MFRRFQAHTGRFSAMFRPRTQCLARKLLVSLRKEGFAVNRPASILLAGCSANVSDKRFFVARFSTLLQQQQNVVADTAKPDSVSPNSGGSVSESQSEQHVPSAEIPEQPSGAVTVSPKTANSEPPVEQSSGAENGDRDVLIVPSTQELRYSRISLAEMIIEELPFWVATPVDHALYTSTTLDDILAVPKRIAGNLRLDTCVVLLSRLAKLVHDKPALGPTVVNMFHDSASVPAWCASFLTYETKSKTGTKLVVKQQLRIGNVRLSLHSLLQIGVSCQNPVVDALQRALATNIGAMEVNALIDFTIFHSRFRDATYNSTALQTALEAAVTQFLPELTSSEQLAKVVCRLPGLTAEQRALLEDRLYLQLSGLNVHQLVSLFCGLASAKQRNIRLIKTIASQLMATTTEQTPLSLSKLLELCAACQTLSFKQQSFWDFLIRSITAQMSGLRSWNKCESILYYMSRWKYRNEALLDELCQWIEFRLDATNAKTAKLPKDEKLVSLLLCLGTTAYKPKNSSVIEKIRDRISRESVGNDRLWLEVIWNLAILNMATPDLLKSVLDKSFYGPLLTENEADVYHHTQLRIKLLQLNACAQLEMTDYDGPLIDPHSRQITFLGKIADNSRMTEYKYGMGGVRRQLGSLLWAALNGIAPSASHSQLQFVTDQGHYLDGALAVDREGQRVPISNWDKQDVTKVAVIMWSYNMYTAGNGEQLLSGPCQLAVRHLKRLGYSVLEINENNLARVSSLFAKTQFITHELELLTAKERNRSKGEGNAEDFTSILAVPSPHDSETLQSPPQPIPSVAPPLYPVPPEAPPEAVKTTPLSVSSALHAAPPLVTAIGSTPTPMSAIDAISADNVTLAHDDGQSPPTTDETSLFTDSAFEQTDATEFDDVKEVVPPVKVDPNARLDEIEDSW